MTHPASCHTDGPFFEPTERYLSDFYARNAKVVARRLIGSALVVRQGDELLGGIIVETEAYLDRGDPACHASRGLTRSNATMFGRPGLLYVYSIHAKYCMNVVTGSEGSGQAVLIRALKPALGLEVMAANRHTHSLRDLARGPSRLCQALDIDRSWDNLDLTESDKIWIQPPPSAYQTRLRIAASPRIGISKAVELPLRFFADGNPFVSGRVGLHTRPIAKV